MAPDLADIRRLRNEKKERERAQEGMDEKERRSHRAENMPIRVKCLNRGEYELTGATEDDVLNNPELMKRFDDKVIQEGGHSTNIIGGAAGGEE